MRPGQAEQTASAGAYVNARTKLALACVIACPPKFTRIHFFYILFLRFLPAPIRLFLPRPPRRAVQERRRRRAAGLSAAAVGARVARRALPRSPLLCWREAMRY